MITKTIVNENPVIYSSFPTMTTYKDYLVIFFRQGLVDKSNPHGFHGKVKCIKIKLTDLKKLFDQNCSLNIQEELVFESQNELDAIVSKLSDNLYTLGTRIFVKNKINNVFLSVSNDCNFKERIQINIKDVNLAALYGKAISFDSYYIFSAYGSLKNENFTRPLFIATSDFYHFELFSYLQSSKDLMLNETSVVKIDSNYIAFSRKDTYPDYAIYLSSSKNLSNWDTPKKLIDFALAPMAINIDGKIFVSFRDNQNNTNKISIINTKTLEKKVIDTYKGSLFDGGYTDLAFIDENIYIIYYTNNIAPFIKMVKLEPF
ncbi:hypothetical protein SAMN05660835_00444 [Desulfurella multipotens]|uniref:Uncharacterized protein n=1 Tax=Desulfurella multipotens TaxID=79269 RepID=A0A1G6JP17_9BACT|nr:hypothetical protein [Desulfurella multipotens]SDC20401.1 hypothetical protein SAMN05660835_00444 [Desulfurella multipotens]